MAALPFENHAFGLGMAKLPILDMHSWILIGGSPKENKQKKNVLCENSVEVRCNDGNYSFIMKKIFKFFFLN